LGVFTPLRPLLKTLIYDSPRGSEYYAISCESTSDNGLRYCSHETSVEIV